MRAVFADTCYWIAVLNPKDQLHDSAIQASEQLRDYRIITTEEVLTELLNYFSARGPHLRGAAARLVELMQADTAVHVLPQTREGFLSGLQLYRARPDKGYSLTDCISMLAMRRDGLNAVLTDDGHFSQEGFTCLLGTP
jgi:uncharacterized protein